MPQSSRDFADERAHQMILLQHDLIARLARGAKIADVVDSAITPEQASKGQLLPDRDLIMLGARWVAAGYDSPALPELACLDPADVSEARALFETALAELGYPRETADADTWRGHWSFIDWTRSQIDRTHTPYATAQRVLEVIGDVPELWEPGRGDALLALVSEWDRNPAKRPELEDEIRAHIWSYRPDDSPPKPPG